MESQNNPVVVDTPGLDVRRELLTASINRTAHDLGWQLSVVSPGDAPLDMVFLYETQVPRTAWWGLGARSLPGVLF